MTSAHRNEDSPQKSLRLWPGIAIVAVQWLARFALPLVIPEAMPVGAIAALVGGLAVVVWWAFFSRAPVWERLTGVGLMAVAIVATHALLHESVATGGMGVIFFIYVAPVLSLAFVLWAATSRGLATPTRGLTMAATIFAACGVWTLVQTAGFTGDGNSDFSWRWAKTAEEQLVAEAADEPLTPAAELAPTSPAPKAPATIPVAAEASAVDTTPEAGPEMAPTTVPAPAAQDAVARTPADWPGFRGPEADGAIRARRIETDWTAAPPLEMWRRAVGPGWSSFAVQGDRLYTQEQRGDDEVVSCYDLTTGEPVWRHRDATRFWESNAGAGPRGTPTLSQGRLYTFGGTGLLNALDAGNGSLLWARNAAEDTGAELPVWGFSSSPLVVDDRVVVAASGSLVAYDAATGEQLWLGPSGGEGYSSPRLTTLDGKEQILHLSGAGISGVSPEDGALLWEHEWKGYPIVQPALTADGDILVSVTASSGIRRLNVARADSRVANTELRGTGSWTVEERWTSNGLKPYFNDFVVHEGHAYGFDGSILASLDLETGERKWKGGRYGNGQLILLAGQDLLLVLSEKGELALVGATPDGFTELARFPAIQGKTWNHPVLVDDVLLVRNGEEMVAFRLPPAAG